MSINLGKTALKNAWNKAKNLGNEAKASIVVGGSLAAANSASAAAITAPDMTDAIGSVTAVFGAVLTVSVLLFSFKKVKSLL